MFQNNTENQRLEGLKLEIQGKTQVFKSQFVR